MNERRLTLLIALLLSLGCSDADSGSDEPWELTDDCPEGGEKVSVLEATLCAYDIRESPIIETGFQCPSQLPHLYEMGESITICSSDENLPPETIDVLEDLFPDVDVDPPFAPGAEPLHDPQLNFYIPTPTVPSRGAGSCTLTGGMDPDHRTRFEYDDTGRPVARYAGPEDDEYLATEWTWDSSGWVAAKKSYGETGDLFREIEYERGPLGHVARKTNRELVDGSWEETVTTWEYDDMWRRISRTTVKNGEETVAEFDWSEDGLEVDVSGPYWTMPCEGTLRYTPDGKLDQYRLRNCPVFGNGGIRREYEDDQWVETWQGPEEPRTLSTQITVDDEGRVQRVRRGSNLQADPPETNPGRVDVEWSEGVITKLIQSQEITGDVLWETTLDGECVLSPEDVTISHTMFGSVLPPP